MEQKAATMFYVRLKVEAQSLAEDRRYVNVAGGARDDQRLQAVATWMARRVGAERVSVVPGPFLRSTREGKLTHMPLLPSSTYGQLIKAMWAAWEISKKMEPDEEMQLEKDEEPKFGNHSLRRFADWVARQSMIENKRLKPETIDYFFGWKLAEMAKEMQLHYAGLDRGGRIELADCTANV